MEEPLNYYTGIAALDAAILDFQGERILWIEEDLWVGDLEMDADASRDLCGVVSTQLQYFLAERSFTAKAVIDPDNPEHAITRVETVSGVFGIDFTAAQYGEDDEFPVVRQLM